MTADLQGRVALVTGGGRGIGRAVSLELARLGAVVDVCYRGDEAAARETLSLMETVGCRGRIRRADVSSAEEVQAMFRAIAADHGRLDILVNNAGLTRDEWFVMMREPSWSQVLATNLSGTYHCCKAAVPRMLAAGRGVIVNVGSGSSLSPRPGQVNYAASKSALIGFTRTLARELAPRGIRVLLVAPGFTATDMSRAVSPGAAEQSRRMIPLGRWGRPEEIAAAIGFFASDEAGYFNGCTVVVDGGRAAMEQDYGFECD